MGSGYGEAIGRAMVTGLLVGAVLLVIATLLVERVVMWLWSHLHISWS
jgi:hypothetical protein